MKIITVMFNPKLGDVKANIESHARVLNEVAEHEANLVVFPELSLTGCLLESLAGEIAQPLQGPFSESIASITSSAAKTTVLFGMATHESGKVFSSQVAVQNKKVIFSQQKIYPTNYGMFNEGRYFALGQNLGTFTAGRTRVGVLVGSDALHPALAYAHAVTYVPIVVVPSSTPAMGVQGEHFTSYDRIERQLTVYAQSFNQFYIYVNRDGVEDGVNFDPQTFIVSPLSGKVAQTYRGQVDGHSYAVFEIDLSDRKSVTAMGSPWQSEVFALNEKIIQQALSERAQ